MARDSPPHLSQATSAEAVEPTEDAVAGPSSSSNHAAPDSGKQPQAQVPHRAAKMSKLEMPTFSGPLEPAVINAWLGRCDDAFFAWSAFNDATVISPQLRIVLAGMKLEETSASTWWSENRDTLKLLPSWDLFTARFKDRFIPSGWRLDALAKFYSISQGTKDLQDFVTQLQAARNALASAGAGYAISDSVFKNHLLMFSSPVLQLRVRALPSLVYESTKVDALINLMSTTWASLVAEGRVKVSTSVATRQIVDAPKSLLVSASPSADYPLPDLSYAERERLRAAGGCYHCRLKPGDPGWKDHQARTCPGDSKRGIPPRSSRSTSTPVQTVSAVMSWPTDVPESREPSGTPAANDNETVAVVMPSYRPLRWSDFDDDSDSDAWDDDDV